MSAVTRSEIILSSPDAVEVDRVDDEDLILRIGVGDTRFEMIATAAQLLEVADAIIGACYVDMPAFGREEVRS